MATTHAIFDHFTNPVDVVEQIATIHAWTFERSTPDELTMTVAGSWCDYHISLNWRDDLEALHLACAFDFKVPRRKLPEVYRLMALINEQLWLGHFDLTNAMGITAQFDHPEFVAAAERLARACGAAGKTAASLDASLDFLRKQAARGYRLLGYSLDVAVLRSGYTEGITALRGLT